MTILFWKKRGIVFKVGNYSRGDDIYIELFHTYCLFKYIHFFSISVEGSYSYSRDEEGQQFQKAFDSGAEQQEKSRAKFTIFNHIKA